MTACKVLARGELNTCLVEFEDGYRVTTSRNYLIKSETLQRRLRKQDANRRQEKRNPGKHAMEASLSVVQSNQIHLPEEAQ